MSRNGVLQRYSPHLKILMNKDNEDVLWRVILWGIFAGILVSIFFYSYNRAFDPDEIENLHTAWKIVQGQEIFVDFFQHHHPFFDYLITPIIRTFGDTVDSIFVSRYFMLMLIACILITTYLLSLRIFKNSEVGIISLILTSTDITFYMKSIEIRPDVPQVLAGLLSIYFLFAYYDKKSLKNLIASSVSLAVSFLFLQKSIVLIVAIGALLIYDVFKKRVTYRHAALYATVFLISTSPYYIYVLLSGTFEQYFVTNWLVNYYLHEGSGRPDIYPIILRENTITLVLYLIGVIMMFRLGKERRFAALSLLLFIIPTILFQNLLRQYLVLAVIPFCVIASYALYSVFDRRLYRLIVVIVAIYIPLIYTHNYGFFRLDKRWQRDQLAKIEYVLSITDENDKVYDGNVIFNVFRDDIDYFWFCMGDTSCLDVYKKVTGYKYNVYDSIVAKKPKVISTYKISNINDARIKNNYKVSERYPDLLIRVDHVGESR